MKRPPIPENEAERQRALDATGLLSCKAEERFDRITRLVRQVFSMPIVLVSLIDRDRQWFKSRQGLDAEETPRDISFCGHAILGHVPLIVENALDDPRFFDNPLVTHTPNIRFYASAPLHTTEGYCIGTLCLIDTVPRSLSLEQIDMLVDFAGTVEELIQADEMTRLAYTNLESELIASRDEMSSLIDNMPGVTYRCLPDNNWTMLYISGQVDRVSGYSAEDLIGNRRVSYADLIHPDDAQGLDEAVALAMSINEQWHVEYRVRHLDGDWRWVEERGKCIRSDPQYPEILEGFIVDITRERNALSQMNKHHDALMLLNDIAFASEDTLDSKIQNALTTARQFLKADLAIISQIEGDVYTVRWMDAGPTMGVVPGQQFSLDQTWCQLLFSGHLLVERHELFIANAELSEFYSHPCYQEYPLGSYAGITIEVDGHAFGTLNFSSSRPRADEFDESEQLFMRLLAGWLSDALTNSLSSERLTKLMVQLPGVIYQFRRYADGHMSFPFSSPQIQNLYGMTPEEAALDASPAFSRIHPDDLETISNSIEYSAVTLDYWQVTFRVRTEHNQYRWIFGQARPERLVDGSVLWHGYLQDIHEQELARLALARNEARLRGLFEFSPIGIALNDFESGQFIDLNDALLAPTGYTRQEFVALSYRDITPIDYHLEEEKALADLTKLGRYGPFEKEYIRKDGSRYPVRLQGMLSEEQDGRRVIWSLIEDITERRRLDKMKDQFIATVSHELRTPLTSIKGSLGLLSGGAAGILPDKAKVLLSNADRNVQRLATLINDLLDMEKLVAGKMTMNMSVQALGPLIDEAVESMASYGDQHRVTITTPLTWPDVWVNVDGPRLIQALTNLLSNAIKHSPEDTGVEVRVEPKESAVEVAVRDHGPGVDPVFRSQLFQRFSQADSSDRRKLPGTGLGLAITREITQQLGGEVNYREATGGGAEFYVLLPEVCS
ncbi:PAS domain-containing protein [Nitrincola nitratireducens]|uniref:histidine kinase n=1 Tax=Nitrincola nitratireducens TaxID=1229521 RepID=W9US26_9GAMM|nr:PAS domain-containing protein [Nitrincola nitratireducens]EXJ10038.1 Sensor protein srrB [Nitrincola nitratireducens]